jgi:hypothetical protein
MLEGSGDAGELRAAAASEREAVERLVASARAIAADADRQLNQQTQDRVAETLQAAGADEEIAERVRTGRLDKEARRAAIGTGALAPVPRRGGGETKKARASHERREAKTALDAARRDLERAEGVVERAQDDVDVHAARLKEAKEALARAKREAKQAAAEVRRAEQRAKKAGG